MRDLMKNKSVTRIAGFATSKYYLEIYLFYIFTLFRLVSNLCTQTA